MKELILEIYKILDVYLNDGEALVKPARTKVNRHWTALNNAGMNTVETDMWQTRCDQQFEDVNMDELVSLLNDMGDWLRKKKMIKREA